MSYDLHYLVREVRRGNAERLRNTGNGEHRPMMLSFTFDYESMAMAMAEIVAGTVEATTGSDVRYIVKWADDEPYRLAYDIPFMREHGITEEEFATEHWQTLFAIQYPAARP